MKVYVYIREGNKKVSHYNNNYPDYNNYYYSNNNIKNDCYYLRKQQYKRELKRKRRLKHNLKIVFSLLIITSIILFIAGRFLKSFIENKNSANKTTAVMTYGLGQPIDNESVRL